MRAGVDLAPLKTSFLLSVAFDCCSTKGKIVNIRALLNVCGEPGMMGRRSLPRRHYSVRKMGGGGKQRVEHQNYTAEYLL